MQSTKVLSRMSNKVLYNDDMLHQLVASGLRDQVWMKNYIEQRDIFLKKIPILINDHEISAVVDGMERFMELPGVQRIALQQLINEFEDNSKREYDLILLKMKLQNTNFVSLTKEMLNLYTGEDQMDIHIKCFKLLEQGPLCFSCCIPIILNSMENLTKYKHASYQLVALRALRAVTCGKYAGRKNALESLQKWKDSKEGEQLLGGMDILYETCQRFNNNSKVSSSAKNLLNDLNEIGFEC